MGGTRRIDPLVLFFLIVFCGHFSTSIRNANATLDDHDAQAQIYIVYLGHKPHHHHDIITRSHHDLLHQVFGSSKEEAKESMLYSYRYSFSGFSAKLTQSQAKKIAEMPGVVKVMKNSVYTLKNTRSWDFLGLSLNLNDANGQIKMNNGLLQAANMGDGVIIGIIDSGIWSNNSKAFSDQDLGPIPSRWKGTCKSEGLFDASIHCNRKIIGTRWFSQGYQEMWGPIVNTMDSQLDDLSPLDYEGHGTHTASTAAGSYVYNLSYYDLNLGGTFRGGAPKARIAIYKACWHFSGHQNCFDSDILAAFDAAVGDGVDVISTSLGGQILPTPSDVEKEHNGIALGSLHAVAHGIPVVAAAGNGGPIAHTVENVAPWLITVAASTSDREFPTPVTLGNTQILTGRGYFVGERRGFVGLHDAGLYNSGIEDLTLNATLAEGKVVLCFFNEFKLNNTSIYTLVDVVAQYGAIGLILVMPTISETLPVFHSDYKSTPVSPIPVVQIDPEAGSYIADYMFREKTRSIVMLNPSTIVQGKPLLPRVAHFSSKGPNPLTPMILKPDIAAPGVDILSATSIADPVYDNGFGIRSGTSMATPHVAGIVALLKGLHPAWSPAAIRSALVTTAWNSETYGSPIFEEGSSQVADPFDYGGGIVNPNGAAYPGLVYDMDKTDNFHYLCSLGYNNDLIYNATKENSETYNAAVVQKMCPSKRLRPLDLNLPSITIPNLKNAITLNRTVTNVASINSVYRAIVKPPRGTRIVIKPNALTFNANIKKISFQVKIYSTSLVNTEFCFGSLTWTDGVHSVRSPISVKKQASLLYR